MHQVIVNMWNVVMDHKHNPLKHIPDLHVRHVVLQLLAWMWCIIFSLSLGSVVVFGFTAALHALLLAGIAITVATFKTVEKKGAIMSGFGRGPGGEHW